jgi:hypothetical protein
MNITKNENGINMFAFLPVVTAYKKRHTEKKEMESLLREALQKLMEGINNMNSQYRGRLLR